MKIRKALPEEFHKIYEQGYKEWPKNRTFEKYIDDNKKEEADGVRYVLITEHEQLAASLMMIQFRQDLFGIGSIVVEPAFRSQGFGKKLIAACLEKHPHAAFILYSEIEPSYYEQFGFRIVPDELQQSSKGVCMVRAGDVPYEQILQEPIPGYF